MFFVGEPITIAEFLEQRRQRVLSEVLVADSDEEQHQPVDDM
jgi:hypothetical protein